MKRWAWIAAALMLASPAWADRLDDVRARGKLLVGVSDTTPPFTFKKPGESEHQGYDVDLVRAVAKRLAIPVETVPVSSALKKDEPRFKEAINRALLDIEASGEAERIFTAWFGPGSAMPMKRSFRIQPD